MSRRSLLRAGRRGEWAELSGGRLDAEVLRGVCLATEPMDPRGLLIRGAEIVGTLDLSGVKMAVPLRFDDCTFAETLCADGARLHDLTVTNCRLLGGLRANGVDIEHDLDLSGSLVRGAISTAASMSKRSAIWLCEAAIGGRLLCVGTRVEADGERAIQADRFRVRGTVRFVGGFVALGEVRLLGARIDGSLDFAGAEVSGTGELAISLADAVIGSSFFLIEQETGRRPVINGRISMTSTRIAGRMLVRNADLTQADHEHKPGSYASDRRVGAAIRASRLSVNGDVTFEGSCRISGELDFQLGDFGSVHFGADCVLDAPDRVAVNLTNAALRSELFIAAGARVAGTLRLEGATINGNLTLRGVTLSRPGSRSLLAASSVRVAGDVDLQDLNADGGAINFRGAELGNTFDASGATLRNPGAIALRLLGARIQGSLRLTGTFTAHGAVELRRSIVEGRVDLRGGEFIGGGTEDAPLPAIDAASMMARGGMYLGWRRAEPTVSFISSHTTVLADDPDLWPARFAISGMTYERFGPPSLNHRTVWDGKVRARWLARQTVFDSGPYEQVAAVLRQHGRQADAEHVLIAQRRQAHREQAATGRRLGRRARAAVHHAYGLFGYGYRPGRAGWPLVLLLAGVFLITLLPFGANTMRATDPRGNVYAPDGRVVTVDPATRPTNLADDFVIPASTPPAADPCGHGQVRCFNPFFYAVDTVVPLVSLSQRTTWYPDPHTTDGRLLEWLLSTATLLGWVLSSILALSTARLARNV
jgi:cytoskeletal protein CcmA (bactofilin family)